MPTFEILPGLPPYGPMPKSFSPDGRGAHREGLVVRFPDTACGPWVGNFQPGVYNLGASTVVEHPDGQRVLVVCEGNGYVVNVDRQNVDEYLNLTIREIVSVPQHGGYLLVGDIHLEFLGREGIVWRSKRISWDGISDVKVEENVVIGTGWEPEDTHFPFEVCMETGAILKGEITIAERSSRQILGFIRSVMSKLNQNKKNT
jgi:hypothetical protein